MSVVSKIKTTKEKVIVLLEKYEAYRDDDLRLCAHVLNDEITARGLDSDSQSALWFLQRYAKGKFTDTGTITRARRQAQEQNIFLRGKKWKERHEEEVVVRQNINNI